MGTDPKEKLDALGRYLSFYTTALKKQNSWLEGIIFFDAFAGPGLSRIRRKTREKSEPTLFDDDFLIEDAEAQYLKGSPRVALDIGTPFTHYIFAELDPGRLSELRDLKSEYGDSRSIQIKEGDSNVVLRSWLDEKINWKRNRAVVFLDPFGMQVPWSTIELLAETKAIEVIINFPFAMAIQRLLTKSGDIPTGWQISLDTFFGSPKWRDLAYRSSADLFGQNLSKDPDSGPKILEWYRGRLRDVFGHVSSALLVKNTRGNPLYYLIWAGPNRLGLKGAQDILGKSTRIPKKK